MQLNHLLLLPLLFACTKKENIAKLLVQGGTGTATPFIAQIESIHRDTLAFCSANWIAPNALLTADHCARPYSEIIYFPNSGEQRGVPKNGKIVLLHPQSPSCTTSADGDAEKCLAEKYLDMALIVFNEALAPQTIPVLLNIPPAKAAVTVYGYGTTNCQQATERVLYTDRKAQLIEANLFEPNFPNSKNRYIELPKVGNSAFCSGDSGGAYVDKKTGAIFGVVGAAAKMADGSQRVYGTVVSAIIDELKRQVSKYNLDVKFVTRTPDAPPPPPTPLPPSNQDRILTSFACPIGSGASVIKGDVNVVLPKGLGITKETLLKVQAKNGITPSKFRISKKSGNTWTTGPEGFFGMTSKEGAFPLGPIWENRSNITLSIEVLKGSSVACSGQLSLLLP